MAELSFLGMDRSTDPVVMIYDMIHTYAYCTHSIPSFLPYGMVRLRAPEFLVVVSLCALRCWHWQKQNLSGSAVHACTVSIHPSIQ